MEERASSILCSTLKKQPQLTFVQVPDLSEWGRLSSLCRTQLIREWFRWILRFRLAGRNHIRGGAALPVHHQLHSVVLVGSHHFIRFCRAEQVLLQGRDT